MDFKELYDAAAAHVTWKRRLVLLLESSRYESPDNAMVGRSDMCALGKWIDANGSRYQEAKAYDELVTEHEKFHLCAAAAVAKMESGDRAGALAMLSGDFETASRRIINAVLRLKDENTQAAGAARRPASAGL